MEFRWIAIITVWTILSGPVFGPPSGGAARHKERHVTKASSKPVPVKKMLRKS